MEQIIIDTSKMHSLRSLCNNLSLPGHRVAGGEAEYVLEDCFLCGHCQAVCPANAIHIPQLALNLGLRTIKERKIQFLPVQRMPRIL